MNWTTNIGEHVNGKTVFHVGNGASFYPIDQVENTNMEEDNVTFSEESGSKDQLLRTPTRSGHNLASFS